MNGVVWVVGGVQGGIGVSTVAAMVAETLQSRAGSENVIGYDADKKGDMARLWSGSVRELAGKWDDVLDYATSTPAAQVVVGLDRSLDAEWPGLASFIEDGIACGLAVNLIVVAIPSGETKIPTLESLSIPITVAVPVHMASMSGFAAMRWRSNNDYSAFEWPALALPARQALVLSKTSVEGFVKGESGAMLHERIAVDDWHQASRKAIGDALIGL